MPRESVTRLSLDELNLLVADLRNPDNRQTFKDEITSIVLQRWTALLQKYGDLLNQGDEEYQPCRIELQRIQKLVEQLTSPKKKLSLNDPFEMLRKFNRAVDSFTLSIKAVAEQNGATCTPLRQTPRANTLSRHYRA